MATTATTTLIHPDKLLLMLSQHDQESSEEYDDSEFCDEDEGSFYDSDELSGSDDENDAALQAAIDGEKASSCQGAREFYVSPEMHNLLRSKVGSTNSLPSLVWEHADRIDATLQKEKAAEAEMNSSAREILCNFQTVSAVQEGGNARKPTRVLKHLMGQQYQPVSHSEFDFWVPWDTNGYSMELTQAVRRNDVPTIEKLHEQGNNLQCSNAFGESIVHTAARRGAVETLTYLREQGVSLRVCCEQGRNPLHDACWTVAPNFDVVRFLMRCEVQFLCMKDKRGLTPLDYVPQAAWERWETFLNAEIEGLLFSFL